MKPIGLAFFILICCIYLTESSSPPSDDDVIYIENDALWTLHNQNGSGNVTIHNVKVPSYVLELLEENGIINDPLYRFNERELSWISTDIWTYQARFNLPRSFYNHSHIVLTLEIIDTIASIYINDNFVGNTSNVHRRSDFDVTDLLLPNSPHDVLTIIIYPAATWAAQEAASYPHEVPYTQQISNTGQYNFIRKPASDFGWDWGPSFAPSGIPGRIKLTATSSILMNDVGVKQMHHRNGSVSVIADTFFLSFPKNNDNSIEEGNSKHCGDLRIVIQLPDTAKNDDDIRSDSRMILKNTKHICLNSSIPKNASTASSREITASTLHSSIQLLIPPHCVYLWWPWDLGQQHLYAVTIEYTTDMCPGKFSSVHSDTCTKKQIKKKNIGLRTVELVQQPTHHNDDESFFFKINKVPTYSRGANVIPMHILESKVDKKKVQRIVNDARRSNMNMLRVWGGGRYFKDSFYDECDRQGILVWQEFMFACALYPKHPSFMHTVRLEAQQQFLRLNSHPSVVIWGGNNENEAAFHWFRQPEVDFELYSREYTAVFIDELYWNVVQKLDQNAVYVDSSPSNGYFSDEDTYKRATIERRKRKRWGDVTDPTKGDVHYYNYTANLFDPESYPPAKFISEFGYMSFPSFFSYSSQTCRDDWTMAAAMNGYRMRHQNGLKEIQDQLRMHYPLPRIQNSKMSNNKSSSSINEFKNFIYLTQLQQAHIYYTAASYWRSSKNKINVRSYGLLYWQLNDVWASPTWSSINSDGRWKILHYYAKKFYSPVAVFGFILDNMKDESCSSKSQNKTVALKMVNDLDKNISGRLVVQVIPYDATDENEIIQLTDGNHGTVVDAPSLGVSTVYYHNFTLNDLNMSRKKTVSFDDVFLRFEFCPYNVRGETIRGGGDKNGMGACIETVLLFSDEPKNAHFSSARVLIQDIRLVDQNMRLAYHSVNNNGGYLGRARNNNNPISNRQEGSLFEIELASAEGIAFYVALESPYLGKFSDNGFVVFPWQRKIIYFEPDDGDHDINIRQFYRTLDVLWLQAATA